MSESGVTSDPTAHAWDDAYAGDRPPWDIGRPQRAFLRLADAGAFTGSLIDVGCGTGEHAILAAQRGTRALGVDLSERAVTSARAKAAARAVDARFRVLDALDLESLGETYDTVLDSGLFHVFDDHTRPRYVAALRAVLREGGHLYLMGFSDEEPGDWGPRRISEAELRAAFTTGWRVLSLERDHFEINPSPAASAAAAAAWVVDVVRV